MLLPSVPLPADSGARLRNASLLRFLTQAHDVDLVAFGGEAPVLSDLGCRQVRCVPVPEVGTLDRARALFTSRDAAVVARFWSPELVNLVQAMATEQAYDVVQAEGVEMARYLTVARQAAPRLPVLVYDAHNVEHLLQTRLAEQAKRVGGAATAAYARIQASRLRSFERDVLREVDLVLAVSEHDANQLEALVPSETPPIQVVPNAIDTEHYEYAQPEPTSPPTILFLGKLDYRPNQFALREFFTQVLPVLQEHQPLLRFVAAGSDPPDWLVAAGQADSRVLVTGWVADERKYLRACTALALPLRAASGSRFKALTAWSMGVPVISTPLGVEGLEAEPVAHYLAADETKQWVEALDQLCSSPEVGRSLAQSARQLVERSYSLDALEPVLRAVYHPLAA